MKNKRRKNIQDNQIEICNNQQKYQHIQLVSSQYLTFLFLLDFALFFLEIGFFFLEFELFFPACIISNARLLLLLLPRGTVLRRFPAVSIGGICDT